jgi:hypothetical protein
MALRVHYSNLSSPNFFERINEIHFAINIAKFYYRNKFNYTHSRYPNGRKDTKKTFSFLFESKSKRFYKYRLFFFTFRRDGWLVEGSAFVGSSGDIDEKRTWKIRQDTEEWATDIVRTQMKNALFHHPRKFSILSHITKITSRRMFVTWSFTI